ncbi:hypothetical protein COW36_01600 [bacterium (Candidatus Blackallbacteria) CG17_big_fil_post_rev_8_21_14_2_50_48_46]|uniref:Uncharacterized protein n=1 Tax=bacterium (Candidatus Blackallbacteria) CG17_big_fil_post_rev_8_21_14_2_50_48_46 TaxID=2014261 RepID=A0A2M7GBP8_9BACT|nr:MAG: hypothetical protein COW64_09575 [bacterium (Candidatus Blackallbacteria) CG18_big_fil_WC_8_21_14_2_50_49_26]PIW19560.1 MAG: hypothetical protein COW36_01600 [bacterium (Candidatus Blackallbacteria) CG17_big_fil_post_rev_8_21_14_2_50_48_46]PIW48837.1 MAG: hypothetical protein COW20_06855 [bacterium (Candidatus Blackallbacteria) CG13_big_fil_rev_8_21_14_2_50_49_14]
MKFFYDSRTDLLGIQFQPPRNKPGKAGKSTKEVMPGVRMGWDERGNLDRIEIRDASRHQPELKNFISELVKEVLSHAKDIPQEILLAIEGTLRLSQEDTPSSKAEDYKPRLSFDAISNVLTTEFRPPFPGEPMMTKREVIPGIVASFTEQGELISMELLQALQHFPALQQFVQQGNEMLAMQHLFRNIGR